MKVFQSSVSEPDHTEDWENWSVERKNQVIKRQANTIILLILVIVIVIANKF